MKTKKILSIAMLVLALASCSSKDDKKAVEVKEELPIVEITTIGAEAVKQMSEYTGTVEAFKTNNISSNSGSRIKRILVDVGSRVARGQRLVILDDVNIAQQQIALANLKRELDRARELVKIGGGTQQTVDQLQAQYDALPHHAGECTHCGACLSRCPFGVDIPTQMDKAKEVFGK